MRSPLIALSLATLLASLGTSIANVGLPTFSREFAVSFLEVRWIVLAYLASLTACAVVAGRLGDRLGRRRILLAGLATFIAASLGCALAPGFGALLVARMVQGAGAAAMAALAMALVAESVPRERAGRVMGWLGTMSAIGTAAGPGLGGMLIATVGWRGIFAVLVPLGLVALVAAHRDLPRVESRSGKPLGQIRFGRPIAVAVAANVLVSAVVMSTLVVGPFHLSAALGLGVAGIGVVMTCGPVAAALAGVPAGRLVDRIGARHTMNLGLVAMTLGCALLATMPTRAGVPGYVVPLIVTTAGYAFFQAANNTAVMARIGAEARGAASGALGLSRNAGLIGGASVMASVFALASKHGGSVAAGTHATFGLAAAVVLATLVFTAWPDRNVPPAKIGKIGGEQAS